MNISFSDKQYRTFMELVYLGMHIAGSVDEENERLDAYEALEQHLLAQAKSFRAEDAVAYDEELDRYFTTIAFERTLEPFILDYNESVFWEELAEHMAERDLDLEIDPDEPLTEEHLQRLFALEQFYREELEQYGLNHFELSSEMG